MVSASEILYSFRHAYPTVIERERQQVSTMTAERDGALITITATGSSYALYDPGGESVAAPTVTVTSNVASVTLTAAMLPSTLTLGAGYLEEWTLVLADGTTRTIRREAVLALRSLHPVVTDDDLEAEYPDLASFSGPDLSSWQVFRDQAWKHIIDRLISAGHLPCLVMSASAFRIPHTELSLAYLFKWFYLKQSTDRWHELMLLHQRRFDESWARLNFVVDLDHDGVADDQSRKSAGGVVHINGAPQRYLTRSSRW